MRIAVISDTHDRLPETLLKEIGVADEIWHLGDICEDGILNDIESLGRPVYPVRGNCDNNLAWPITRTLTRDGLRFFLVHIPPTVVPSGCDAVLHGHTHVPRDETIGGVRFLNPGCVSCANRGAPPSFAFMEIVDGAFQWRNMPLR